MLWVVCVCVSVCHTVLAVLTRFQHRAENELKICWFCVAARVLVDRGFPFGRVFLVENARFSENMSCNRHNRN